MATAKKPVPAKKPAAKAPPAPVKKPAAKAAPAPVAAKEPKAAKRPVLKIPKTLGACADLLYEVKNKRLALDKDSAAMKADETLISDHIINKLPKSDANGIAGHVVRVTVSSRDVPRAEDWSKIYAEIVKNYLYQVKKKTGQQDGAFALLQRRLGDAAVAEAWDAKKTVPGVTKFKAISLSINKL